MTAGRIAIALALAVVMAMVPDHAAAQDTPEAAPNTLGQTGLVHMPDGRIEPDGTLRSGISYMAPYGAFWASVAMMPWLEVSGRYTRSDDVPAFGGTTGFGDSKDKAFDLKLRLAGERAYTPAVSIGMQDFHGTRLFRAEYLALSKRVEAGGVGSFDLTAGFGRHRIDGPFGGVRWRLPGARPLALVAEWDAIDYPEDFHAQRTGELVREGGLTLAAEVRHGWWHAQLAHQDGEWGANVSLSVPLQQRDFIAKDDEPPPVPVQAVTRPGLADWRDTPASMRPLLDSLAAEGFGGVYVRIDGDRLDVSVDNWWTTMSGRAASRAARVIALHAPDEARALTLTLVERGMPLVTYRFEDLAALRGYYAGTVTGPTLQDTLSAAYVNAADWARLRAEGTPWDAVVEPGDGKLTARVGETALGAPVSLRRDDTDAGTFSIQPFRLLFFFNDPAGAFKYDLYTLAGYARWLADGLVFRTSVRYTLTETISETISSSNSLLPRVRSDVPRYRRDGERLKLNNLYVAHYANPADRVYTVLSAGIYEEMFAGIGGEALYLPASGDWAADVRAYGVRQRDFGGRFGFQDYQTVTAQAAFHYRFPRHGVTVTARAGRFLARDNGVRFEAKRRFRSGFELGAWYSITDAKDITSPGTPDDPYRDKGIFLRYALAPWLTRDNSTVVDFSLAPWARDPAQMVRAPGGLYDNFERRLMLNIADFDQWTDFGR